MQWIAHLLWRGLAVVDLALVTVMLWLQALLPRALVRSWYPRLFGLWCRVFVRALDVQLHRHEHYAGGLPAQYLLIANHPSAFEDVGIPALFPVYSVAKAGVRDWWFAGRIADRAGTLFVARDDPDSRSAVMDELEARLRAGDSIAIYPEGGCFGRRLTPDFKYGAFVAAYRTGVPLLPVFIHYEGQEAFEWQGQSLPRKILQIATATNRHAHFHVFDPIDPRAFDDVEALRDAVIARYLSWQERYLN